MSSYFHPHRTGQPQPPAQPIRLYYSPEMTITTPEASTSHAPPFAASEKGLPYQLDYSKPGLRKLRPYWYAYTTMAKGRWLDREILEVISTEFRDRSVEYYVSPSLV